MNDATANRPKASAKISSIAIRDCTNSIWSKNAISAAATAALGREQRQAAEIHRDHRERTEQGRRIAPAQRGIAEAADRQRDHLLCQRRMHRIEHRRRYHGSSICRAAGT